jgi:tyrosinase
MRTEITLNGSADPSANYICWSPVRSRIRLADSGGVANPVDVRLKNRDTSQGGQVVFFAALPGAEEDELQLSLPADGSPVDFFVAGKFDHPSIADKDASIEVVDTSTGDVLSVTQLMVRIRKDANKLTQGERDLFISALARLNNGGMGRFSDFRNMHRDILALKQAHGDAGFLPWHRAYLLDLERELQRIEPSVALPYWKFDEPARNVFTMEFMGVSDPSGAVQFSSANLLRFWATDQAPQGIDRLPLFNPLIESAQGDLGPVIDEDSTINLGDIYALFLLMEGQPHGAAHRSFTGSLHLPHTAPKDPLFFLLHANVDRLWAKWQWVNRRFDITSAETYEPLGSAGVTHHNRLGHFLDDTLWPWDQDMSPPRPSTAPGGYFPDSLVTSAPGLTPAVRDMIDFQGLLNPSSRLGFDYDNVRFEF